MFRNRRDYQTIKQSGLFDENYYFLQNPDVREADVDPLMHFVKFGWREGRNPSPVFDTSFYLSSYQDVKEAGINPLVHYIKFGLSEGRKPVFIEDVIKAAPIQIRKREAIRKKLPKFSIVIPVFNALSYTMQCLEALLREDKLDDLEIIVIDNGSTDGTLDWLKETQNNYPGIVIIENDCNRGFAPAVNQGINQSLGEKVVILNNDTIPGKGWLTNLSNALDSDNALGIVSPVTNYVGEGLQIDPQAIDITPNDVDQYAMSIDRRESTLFVSRRLVFFCVMLRRSVIDRIGVLDEGFVRGNFEDDEYCARVIMSGYKLGIVNNAFVYHHGSATFKSNEFDYVQNFEENKVRFFKKISRMSSSLPINSLQNTCQKPTSAVIVRTVNRPLALKQALNSLVNQIEKDFEVILVNDGGPNLSEFIKPYEKLLPIKYTHIEKSQGRSAALTAGIQASSASWIAILDDDIYYPWFFSDMNNAKETNPECCFFYGMANRTLFDLENSPDSPLELYSNPKFEFSRDRLLIGNMIPINTWFIKREIFEEVGFFDESFNTLEDYEFLLRATSLTTPICVPDIISEYRFYLSSSNSMVTLREDSLRALKRIYALNPIEEPEMIKSREETIYLHQRQVEDVASLLEQSFEGENDGKHEMVRRILKIIGAL